MATEYTDNNIANDNNEEKSEIIKITIVRKYLFISWVAKLILENINLFDFELSEADMITISSLNQNKRLGPDPDNFNF